MRNERMEIRCTEADLEAWRRCAQAAGESLATWVRGRLTAEARRVLMDRALIELAGPEVVSVGVDGERDFVVFKKEGGS